MFKLTIEPSFKAHQEIRFGKERWDSRSYIIETKVTHDVLSMFHPDYDGKEDGLSWTVEVPQVDAKRIVKVLKRVRLRTKINSGVCVLDGTHCNLEIGWGTYAMSLQWAEPLPAAWRGLAPSLELLRTLADPTAKFAEAELNLKQIQAANKKKRAKRGKR